MEKYVFKKYSHEYTALFLSEKKKLAKILGKNANIEHIGSTAVPGLGGKGILDIIIGIIGHNLDDAKKKLIKAGYEFRAIASVPERLFFRRDYNYKKENRRVHIHLIKFKSNDWNKMIKFRDYLIKHPESVEQYMNIKKQAVKKASGDGEKYRKYKEKFIKNILKKTK